MITKVTYLILENMEENKNIFVEYYSRKIFFVTKYDHYITFYLVRILINIIGQLFLIIINY